MNKFILYIVTIALIFASCSLSKDVNNGSWIQKRKYNKGFHIRSKVKNSVAASTKEFNSDGSIASTHRSDSILEPVVYETSFSKELDLSESIKANLTKEAPQKESILERREGLPKIEGPEKSRPKEIQQKIFASKQNMGHYKPSISESADILIYIVLCVVLIPLILGTLYLIYRGCSLSQVLLNLVFIGLFAFSVFFTALLAFTGGLGSITVFIVLSILFFIATILQGASALRSVKNSKEDPEFYILD